MEIENFIREYLPEVVHMSLGTSRDNKPWVCEVHFAFDNDLNVYFRSLKSRRHSQEIADNPRVAGNIVKQHPLGVAPSGVYFEGTASLLDQDDDIEAAFKYLDERLGLGPDVLVEAKSDDGHNIYKISVENWYVFGKIGDQKIQKYQLEWGK
jgi:uncharacterized protein YhbP (UPF0306 family)